MASQRKGRSDSLQAFWEALIKRARANGLKNNAVWYRRANEIAETPGVDFMPDSTFYTWVSIGNMKSKRTGKYAWEWDRRLQLIVQAAVGVDESDWKPWEERWLRLQKPGRYARSFEEETEKKSRKHWLTTAAVIVGLIAAVLSVMANGKVMWFSENDGSTDGSTTASSNAGPKSPSSSKRPTCHGTDCAGKSPEEYGCGNGASVMTSENLTGAYEGVVLQVKYNEDCQAVWVKITGGMVGDIVEVHIGDTVQRDSIVELDNKFTPMLPASTGTLVRACVSRKGLEHYCLERPVVVP